jgi:hypothetical protein
VAEPPPGPRAVGRAHRRFLKENFLYTKEEHCILLAKYVLHNEDFTPLLGLVL